MATRTFTPLLAIVAIALVASATIGAAQTRRDQVPTIRDMSPAGLRASASISSDPQTFLDLLPEAGTETVRDFVAETRRMGLAKRSSILFVPGPTNVKANTNVGDAVGETQAEVAVAVFRDTVVIGWNDSRGFVAGNTVSSYAYSTDGGATFVDGGNVPLAVASDQAFGDPGWDTDETGNWYFNQIYTRTAAGGGGGTAQQNIGVHHARFNNLGVLVLDPPTMASIGTTATGNLDKCLLGVDRVTGNVYVSYTRFTAIPQIEIVRSTTLGATWNPPIVLDNTSLPTTSKQAARPFCGPNGEVYVVWEKGANTINCPDAATGNLSNPQGQIGFTRSLNFGASYDPFTIIGNVDLTFMSSGPGDLRERGNEFPDIAVDMSPYCYRGNIYVTWHEAGTWTSNLAAGPARAEAADAANNNPTGPEVFNVGDDCTGTISATADLDYWQFNAVQGQSYLMNLDPNTFNCGVTGAGSASMRMRLFAVTNPFPNPNGFPDSLLAASAQGGFADRIVWTCPLSGNYLIRLQRAGAGLAAPYPYRLRVRPLNFVATSPARDARDITLVRSGNQGLTWSAEQRINDDPAGLENRRPFIAVNSSGQVAAFWHDSRDAGFGSTASLTSVYGTLSRDGGASWSPNFTVTDELSFFSFNTLAVPNLGDYNQAAAGGTAVFHPAWSDQRISTGDVRTPGTNSYTAGLGPETYTTGISFFNSVACAADTFAAPGSTIIRRIRLSNNGTGPDRYSYSITDNAGWIGGPITGTTGTVLPGSFFDVFVTVNVALDCTPPQDLITVSVLPVGEACLAPQVCQTRVSCDLSTATLLQRFDATSSAAGVDLDWGSDAVGSIREWNVYRSREQTGGFERINATPIAMNGGGGFHYRDASAPAGTVYYRIAAVLTTGAEEMLGTLSLANAGFPQRFAFAVAGANPFSANTALTFSLPKATPVSIDVFSVTGQRVRTLVSGVQQAGVHTVPFDRRDMSGQRLRSGVYMVRITAGRDTRSLHLVALD